MIFTWQESKAYQREQGHRLYESSQEEEEQGDAAKDQKKENEDESEDEEVEQVAIGETMFMDHKPTLE